jgi:hypothetical protein
MLDLQLQQIPDQPLPLLQLYDRISSRAISPSRAPPSDAVQRCRDLTDWLRDTLVSVGVSNHQAHHTPTNNNVQAEMRELATILMKPHFKVGHASLIVDAYSKSLPWPLNFVDLFAFVQLLLWNNLGSARSGHANSIKLFDR